MRGLFAMLLSCGLLGLAACGGGGNSAQMNPTPTPTPATALSVSGSSTVGTGATADFMAKDSTGTVVAANWSVSATAGTSSPGTIVSTTNKQGNPVGRFTAPPTVISPKTVTVTATSQSNSSATGNTSIELTDNAGTQTGAINLGTSGGNSTDSVTNATTITCCSGTLGSLIQRGGVPFILSNNHVLDKSSFGAPGTDTVTQPGLVDNNCSAGRVVATLSEAAALKPSPCSGVCTGPAPSNVDAAIAQVMAGAVDPFGNILDLGAASSTSIAPAPPSSTLAIPANVLAANEGVAKSGRSTGLTCSNLQSVSTMVSVDYDSSCGGAKAFTATFTNQVVINGGSFSAGGDSGSLVVTSDTARPVGLLYAGNSTSSTANPIQDVFNAFSGGGTVTFISNADHTVSCSAVSQPHIANLTASKPPSPQEAARVTPVRDKYVNQLFTNSTVLDVNVGTSVDNPQEGAVVITVQGATTIPPQLDGVRTRVIYANSPVPRATVADLNRAATIKEAHVQGLMSQPGIQGVGVGVSDDNPAEPAMVIYTIAGIQHSEIPAVIDGLRTKIVEGDRFRAFGWGKETRPSACSPQQPRKAIGVKAVEKLSGLP